MTDIAGLVRALLNGCMHGAIECPRCRAARALEAQAAEIERLRTVAVVQATSCAAMTEEILRLKGLLVV